MKVSLNLVKQFTNISIPVEELITLATERLGGVEGYEDFGKRYDGIVIARVVSCKKHPNADKLSVCLVDDGGKVKDIERDKDEYVQVVCGAPNVKEGLLVAWIPPSSIVPSSYSAKELFVLDARDLRGEISNGMIASPSELGINDDHSGILEIDEDVKPGTPFKELYELDDTVLEIENKMLTHRPDGFGQLGLSREISGIQHQAFTSPDWYLNPKLNVGENENLKITIETPELCPRYMAVKLDNITIKPSPLWLQSCLKRLGIKPVNNVVDITNYIMVLTAQPLHAFDFKKIATGQNAEIIVRKPNKGEKITLLDGKEIEPHSEAVLICNTNGPIALGGVMGGGNSEIDSNSTSIILECATFDMYNIRKTSMTHGIFTEAVTRFNKGQPAEQLPSVLSHAIKMLEDLADAKVSGTVVDNYPKIQKKTEYIELTPDFINDRLGSKLKTDEIIKLLTNVEFTAHEASGPISVSPPFWRTDIEIKEDIVEEIGRLYGFNQLDVKLPIRSIKPAKLHPELSKKQRIRQILSRSGANEVLSYSFVHGNLFEKVEQDFKHAYKLRNALSPDLQYYRLSLTPGLLEKVHPNIKSGFKNFALFELGKTHFKGEMDAKEPDVPNEDNQVAFVVASNDKDTQGVSAYFLAKKYLEQIAPDIIKSLTPLNNFDLSTDEWGRLLVSPYNPERSSIFVKDGQIWGVVGEFKSEVQKALKLPMFVAGFEVHLDILNEEEANYKSLSRFPSTEQDLTLKVGENLTFAQLESIIVKELNKSDYQWHLKPLSIYQKEGETTKSVSFRFTFTRHDRTMTTEEITKLIENISFKAVKELKAEVV